MTFLSSLGSFRPTDSSAFFFPHRRPASSRAQLASVDSLAARRSPRQRINIVDEVWETSCLPANLIVNVRHVASFPRWRLCPDSLLHQSGNITAVMSSWCGAVRVCCHDVKNGCSLIRYWWLNCVESCLLVYDCSAILWSNYTWWKLIFFSASHLEESQPLTITEVYLTVKSISLMNGSQRRGTD